MNRKGVAILSLAAIGFLIAIVLFYGQVDKLPGNQKKYLGEAEVNLFNTYIAAEKELLYIDLMAKYALDDSYEGGDLLIQFKKNFGQRLVSFNEVYGRDISINDYQIKMSKDNIVGITNKQLNITTDKIDYNFRPSFRISL